MAHRTWLFKSEPDEFSLDDLKNSPRKTAMWDGVRNYQARNLLRDDVKRGDQILYYHSNIKEPAIVGIAEVVREGYPDPTAFDPSDKHYDPRSDPQNPRWIAVDVRYRKSFRAPLTRQMLQDIPALREMLVLRRGMRLSIQPVTAKEWKAVLKAAGVKA